MFSRIINIALGRSAKQIAVFTSNEIITLGHYPESEPIRLCSYSLILLARRRSNKY
jgi:hypothetical protein